MLQPLYDRAERVWAALKGWRTVALGVLIAVPSAILAILELFSMVDLSLFLSPRTAVIVNLVIGILVIVLRFATTTPLGVSEPESGE